MLDVRCSIAKSLSMSLHFSSSRHYQAHASFIEAWGYKIENATKQNLLYINSPSHLPPTESDSPWCVWGGRDSDQQPNRRLREKICLLFGVRLWEL